MEDIQPGEEYLPEDAAGDLAVGVERRLVRGGSSGREVWVEGRGVGYACPDGVLHVAGAEHARVNKGCEVKTPILA